MRTKTSPIWLMPTEEFRALVERATSIADILRFFSFAVTGGGSRMIKQRCLKDGISLSHIPLGLGSNRKRDFSKRKKTKLKDILVENSTFNRVNLKKRLIAEGLLENECSICGMPPVWNGQSLVMRIDHINGIRDDNRLDNLRLVCPNCDSQLPTFAGRNNKFDNPKRKCPTCDGRKDKNARQCNKCCTTIKKINTKRKVQRPSKDVLAAQVNQLGYCGTARIYGVSDNAVRKWLK